MAEVAPDLKKRTLTVNGVSKSYAMTGWRVGYGAGPLELIRAMNTIQGQTTSNASSISQHAAIAALSGDQKQVDEFARAFRARRDLMVAGLSRIPGLECSPPAGAFHVFPSCAAFIGARTPAGDVLETDADFTMYLLEHAGVAVVPGSGFLASPFIRLSYAASESDVQEACRRIGAACEALVSAPMLASSAR